MDVGRLASGKISARLSGARRALMSGDLLSIDTAIRLGVFVGVFAVIALCEWAAPRRMQTVPRRQRWPANLGIVALNTVLLRLVFPVSAVGVALLVERHSSGLLHVLAVPGWVAVPLAFVLLDLAIYLQHVLFHSVPALWRLHRMHHADVEFDVTNGLRFHPLEMLLSMAIKMAVIALLGAPPIAVLAFEVVLNAAAMFNHGNLNLPARIEPALRRLIVTPDMHRIHHSALPEETHSNFGFNLPWWDHVFGTYVDQPRDGQLAMQLGLPMFREPCWRRLDRLLVQPWIGPVGVLCTRRRATPAPMPHNGHS
jgi:sterol desaturase/sphingolipid hydroxylase (fatty acid hydroxylase superfamily)